MDIFSSIIIFFSLKNFGVLILLAFPSKNLFSESVKIFLRNKMYLNIYQNKFRVFKYHMYGLKNGLGAAGKWTKADELPVGGGHPRMWKIGKGGGLCRNKTLTIFFQDILEHVSSSTHIRSSLVQIFG